MCVSPWFTLVYSHFPLLTEGDAQTRAPDMCNSTPASAAEKWALSQVILHLWVQILID